MPLSTGDPAGRLGIVAGGGDLPARLIEACRARGQGVYVVALEGQADGGQLPVPPDAWVRLGQAGRALDLFREAGIRRLAIAGRVRRPGFAELRPDAWTARFLTRIGKAFFGDDTVLSAIARALEEEGFEIVAPESVVDGLMAEAQLYVGNPPDDQATGDIARGIEAARAIGRLDIGQAAVVQQGCVLGLEGVDGTDALIARCARLRLEAPGGVLVKVSKPGQERRIDLPTIGPATVAAAAAAGLRGIAVEAGGALIVDADAVVRAAEDSGLFVIGVPVGDEDSGSC